MAFNPDIFKQAEAEVKNKSMSAQIAHSGIFHSMRSAFSSGGSAASKGVGLAVGVGKLFLALIPVPIVGSVVGASVDVANGIIRSRAHKKHTESPNASNEEKAKFLIKELTVENLDRCRWKVAHAFEEMNKGISAFNESSQNCDDMYKFALLYEQVQRRKGRLNEELDQFKKVITAVNGWIAELEAVQELQLNTARNKITNKTYSDIENMKNLVPSNAADAVKISQYMTLHAGCKDWCCIKKQAAYDPNTRWETLRSNAVMVAGYLLPIAVSAVAVRKSDYTSESDNSKFSK